jgi:tRNA(Arg) A34 adenosine deaminase TadA
LSDVSIPQVNPGSEAADDVDRRMMQRAIAMAERAAAMGEVPVGAAVYRGEMLLAEAHNRREVDRDPSAHAELLAMREAARSLASWRLDECSVAVTLEPCPMCAGAMVNARLGRLVYGAADPKMGAVDTLYDLCRDSRLNHRVPTIISGLEADRCAGLLRAFFQRRRGEFRPPKPGFDSR